MVIGALVPDAVMFINPFYRMPWNYGDAHSFLGVWLINIPLGMVLWLCWEFVIAPGYRTCAPKWLALRLPDHRPTTLKKVAWAIPSVLVGICTHLLWDSFTHAGYPLTSPGGPLDHTIGKLSLFRVLQHGSSVLGLGGVLLWILLLLRYPKRRSASSHWRLWPWLLPVITGVMAPVYLIMQQNFAHPKVLKLALLNIVTGSVSGVLVCAFFCALLLLGIKGARRVLRR
ncbi:hypothetical protein CPPEL_07670 [Corynebacterium pseudopelargi]|uniref:DUF4184 family protein n=2 Tax=Corynebacterium pseudopelargi TaxID=2080757 RepID=A0A3G6IVA7_9CORY|nr:hypothetical protein CPPEL_07670 [Corynebacterium pseudopelargi]